MLGAVEEPGGVGVDVDDMELVPVVGHGHQRALRRGGQVGDAPQVHRLQPPALGLTGLVDLDAVLAALVAHHDHGGAVADPGGQAVPHPVGTAVLADGLLPQRHREELPPGLEGDGVPGGVEGEVALVPVGGHELAGPLHPRAVEVDPDPVPLVGGGVVEPDLGGVLVDDPGAVGLGEAGVVLVVVGVAAEVAPVGRGRVEVADPLVVGQEPDPVADPHRGGGVAGQAEESAEVAVAPPVDPQVAGGAAPVALPPGGVGGVAPEDDGRPPAPAVAAAPAAR